MNMNNEICIEEIIFLHYRMIFRNAIQEKKTTDLWEVGNILMKIVTDNELPELPKTSVSYKIISKIIPTVDWTGLAQRVLEDTKKKF